MSDTMRERPPLFSSTNPLGLGGIIGPQGPQGASGPQGPQGSSGGPQGSQGASGPQGPRGPQGPQGPQGASGPQGPQGGNGPTGSVGPQGTQGASGAAGSQGPQGANGTAGAVGSQGAQGATGAQGPQGASGANGNTGNTGPQGPQGASGTNGAQGPQGPQGATGAGTQGATGAQGAQGPQGSGGIAGPGGIVQVKSNANVNSFATGANSNLKVVTGNDFIFVGSSSLAFTANGCLLTYTGPNARVLVVLTLSYKDEGGSGRCTVGIAKDGDLVGTSIFSGAGVQAGIGTLVATADGNDEQLTAQRVIDLVNGTTIRPVAGSAGGLDMTINSLSMSIFPIPN